MDDLARHLVACSRDRPCGCERFAGRDTRFLGFVSGTWYGVRRVHGPPLLNADEGDAGCLQCTIVGQVTTGAFMCGPAKRVWRLERRDMRDAFGEGEVSYAGGAVYDRAVDEATSIYAGRTHNLVVDNCHSHVATVLNLLRYDGHSNWNQVRVFWMVWTKGKWTSKRQAVVVFLPFFVLVAIVVTCSVAIP